MKNLEVSYKVQLTLPMTHNSTARYSPKRNEGIPCKSACTQMFLEAVSIIHQNMREQHGYH